MAPPPPRLLVALCLWLQAAPPASALSLAAAGGERSAGTVVVLTMNRARSLQRLLDSLLAAEYSGEAVRLRFEVDIGPGAHDPDAATLDLARSFVWPHGEKVVNVRRSNAGLAKNWIEHAWPTPRVETGTHVILEDDVTVSTMFWNWLRHCHAAFAGRPDIAGCSLQRQTLRTTDGVRLPRIGPENRPYLYRLVGSIGFSPFQEVWREFRTWKHAQASAGKDPYVPGLKPSSWWRRFLAEGRGGSMWTMWFIRFSQERGLFTVYQNPTGGGALATHWREAGVHRESAGDLDFPVCREPGAVALPNVSTAQAAPRFGWDAARGEASP